MRTTRADIARAAGVSLTTVSDVMNNTETARLSEDTKARVREVAQKLGYRANTIARGLVMRRSFNIGVVICRSRQCSPFVASSYALNVMHGIQDAIAEHDQSMMISLTDSMADMDYIGLLRQGRVDGLIVLQAPIAEVEYMEADEELSPFPVVMVSSHTAMQKLPCVCIDNRQGIFDSVAHLVELGHRRIAYSNESVTISDFVERMGAYVDALDKHGIPYDPEIVIEQLDDDSMSGSESVAGADHTKWYLALERMLRSSNPPTAIVAANDGTALRMIQTIKEIGFSVPEDVSVVGFDDVEEFARLQPRLTTVRQPMRELGVVAAERILDLISGEESSLPARTTIPVQLIIRESTGKKR